MTMMLIGALLALILAEMVDVCPWLAARMVRSAARRIPDPKLATRFEEEWLGVIERRPGKLLKLVSALGIVTLGAHRVRKLARPKPHVSRLRRVWAALSSPLPDYVLPSVAVTDVAMSLVVGWETRAGLAIVTMAGCLLLLRISTLIRRRRSGEGRDQP
ncbi:hypothetical protein [Embleya sp. NPDC059237]|uniref:hypothetical protein n=1 Tax=Embleya sp. NPDC059237 TaxID=3346784 RepID=UPI0036CB0398